MSDSLEQRNVMAEIFALTTVINVRDTENAQLKARAEAAEVTVIAAYDALAGN